MVRGPEPALNQVTKCARPARRQRKLHGAVGLAGKPVDDETLEAVARRARRCAVTGVSRCAGTSPAERWAGCAPESLRCWIIR